MSTAIVWFRKSLRLHDNEFLTWACSSDDIDKILPIFIIDLEDLFDENHGISYNRIRFLQESLEDSNARMEEKLDSNLTIFSGKCLDVIQSLSSQFSDGNVYLAYEYCSEPVSRKMVSSLNSWIIDNESSLMLKEFSSQHTLLDIEQVISSPDYKNPKSMKDMERIFSKHLGRNSFGFYDIQLPLPVPSNSKSTMTLSWNKKILNFDELDHIINQNFPNNEDITNHFIGGETEALSRLSSKIVGKTDFVNTFQKPKTCSTNSENEPREPSTTGLSPYISHGCLSVRMLWTECEKSYLMGEHTKPPQSLHGQMMFREMFYLLSRSVENWDQNFENDNCKSIDWGEYDLEKINAWESGNTGFPLIDAMMRQLDKTGWMHHLGRHAVSCFLTRGQLWQNWIHGRDVFERKLIDSDWAINNGNWLWLAGVAPFSMPYYRIYNPCPDSKSSLNVETENANFVRYWVPELSAYPSKYIFEPHLAPISVQISSQCIIGEDYPMPIVDRKITRKENIEKFKLSVQRSKN